MTAVPTVGAHVTSATVRRNVPMVRDDPPRFLFLAVRPVNRRTLGAGLNGVPLAMGDELTASRQIVLTFASCRDGRTGITRADVIIYRDFTGTADGLACLPGTTRFCLTMC